MFRCHDFINGFYYEDPFTGETISEEDYFRQEMEKDLQRECQQYILIEKCESLINNTKFFCDIFRWHYNLDEKKPARTIILSKNEYIKLENKRYYYRSYDGNSYTSLKVIANKLLELEKIEEIFGFFLCTKKGKGALYTKEQFIEKFVL